MEDTFIAKFNIEKIINNSSYGNPSGMVGEKDIFTYQYKEFPINYNYYKLKNIELKTENDYKGYVIFVFNINRDIYYLSEKYYKNSEIIIPDNIYIPLFFGVFYKSEENDEVTGLEINIECYKNLYSLPGNYNIIKSLEWKNDCIYENGNSINVKFEINSTDCLIPETTTTKFPVIPKIPEILVIENNSNNSKNSSQNSFFVWIIILLIFGIIIGIFIFYKFFKNKKSK